MRGNYGHASTVVSGTWTNLMWKNAGGADALIDYTDPANPTFVAEGIYAVSILLLTNPSAGKFLIAELDIGSDFNKIPTFSLDDNHGALSSGNAYPFSGTYYAPAGGILALSVKHDIGADHVINFDAYIQRLQ